MSAKYIEPATHIDLLCLSGRWVHNANGSISTSWTGSSLSFRFSGNSLELACGENTERKDKWNGDVPMIAISINPTEPTTRKQNVWTAYDVEAGAKLCLPQNQERGAPSVTVHVMMIDWASTYELQYVIVDQDASITKPPNPKGDSILYIGDSITCGYFVEPDGTPIPGPPSRGCLDAFPNVAQQLLVQNDPALHVCVDLVSYPGWSLVPPSDKDKSEGNPSGMFDGYFQISPWSTETHEYPQPSPTAVVIELGTNDQEYYSVECYETYLSAFIDKVLRNMTSAPQYIWIIPPFLDFVDSGQTTDLQQAFPNLVYKLQTKYQSKVDVELCDIVSSLTRADTFDGLHPSIEGHTKLGVRMAEFIRARFEDL